jgi:predicted aldo/keto reductase-like oxidoreductase
MTMLYRPFGRTGEMVSILGFGCMRLPVVDGRQECIDVPRATEMVRYAIDHGVNYIDTAYPYHNTYHRAVPDAPGMSEPFVAHALAGGYREKVLLATKLPGWLVERRADMDRFLATQLQQLQTERIDCYLLHGLNADGWRELSRLGVLEFLDAAKKDGRIRYAGFSFHDGLSAFAPIVDAYDWDFCQIQYNFMDVDFQAGAAGLEYAADKGMGVVIMEPLKGGRLAGRPPAAVQTLWDTAPVRRAPVEWALRFVWDHPGVSLLLSGMSTIEQVIANVGSAAEGEARSLQPAELELIARVREAYRALPAVDCTGCRYCQPCPQGIDIPLVLSWLNNAILFDALETERTNYGIEVDIARTAPASECIGCGQCEEACPQGLHVIDELARASQILGP